MPSEALVTPSKLSNLNINLDNKFDYELTLNYLSTNGYVRVSSIREPGEFSVKGDVTVSYTHLTLPTNREV